MRPTSLRAASGAALALCAVLVSASAQAPGNAPDAAARLRVIAAFLAGVPVDAPGDDPALQPLIARVRAVQDGTGGSDGERMELLGQIGRLAQDLDPLRPAMPSPAVVHCYQDHVRGRPLSCAGAGAAPLASDAPLTAQARNAAMLAAAARYSDALRPADGDAVALALAVGPGPSAFPPGGAPGPAKTSSPRAFLSDLAHEQFTGIDGKIAMVDQQREQACANGTVGCMLLPYVAASGRVVQYSWTPFMLAGDLIKDPAGTAYQATVGGFKEDMGQVQATGAKCLGTGSGCGDYAKSVLIAGVFWNPLDWGFGAARAGAKAAVEDGARAAEAEGARAAVWDVKTELARGEDRLKDMRYVTDTVEARDVSGIPLSSEDRAAFSRSIKALNDKKGFAKWARGFKAEVLQRMRRDGAANDDETFQKYFGALAREKLQAAGFKLPADGTVTVAGHEFAAKDGLVDLNKPLSGEDFQDVIGAGYVPIESSELFLTGGATNFHGSMSHLVQHLYLADVNGASYGSFYRRMGYRVPGRRTNAMWDTLGDGRARTLASPSSVNFTVCAYFRFPRCPGSIQ
jgi:hypothetical protein